MVSKFKAETGTSQMNFKDHADPVLVCKPARDGSMIATGAADHAVCHKGTLFVRMIKLLNQVVLRHTGRDRLKSVKDKVVLLGHSVPVTEALFTNDVRIQAGVSFMCDNCNRTRDYVVSAKMAAFCFGMLPRHLFLEMISRTLAKEVKCKLP